MITINALDELSNSREYDLALMTTFNLDVDFFERFIAGRIYGNEIKKIALFVDAKELNKAINNTWKKSLMMGSRYSVNPVRMPGAFHPKVTLLVSNDSAKLIVASANFTQSGYSTNNEVFNVFEVSSEHTKHLPIIKAAAEFFLRIYSLSYTFRLDDKLMQELQSIPFLDINTDGIKGDTFLLNSIDKPIANQMKDIIGNVSQIDIAVPFYDNNLEALIRLKKDFNADVVNTYVQNHQSRFNVSKADDLDYVTVKAFKKFEEPESSSFYHGKVIRFLNDNSSWILYGSANCTGAALYSTAAEGGNVECCILEKGEPEEFNYFFDNMCLQDSAKDVVCNLLDFKSNEAEEHYYFKYGESIDSDAVFNIGVVGPYVDPEISLYDTILEHSYDVDSRTISLRSSFAELPTDSDVYDIKISDITGDYEVKGWLYRPEVLEANRETEQGTYKELKFDFDAEGDEYLENLLNVVEVLSVYSETARRRKDIIKTVQHVKSDTIEDYEDAPEGIIDYVIPPRIATSEEIREYEIIKKAQKISHSFSTYSGHCERREKRKKKATVKVKGGRRQPTSIEKYLKRRFLREVSAMLNEENIGNSNAEDYINHACLILDTVDILTDSKVEGMFDMNRNVDIRCDLAEGILKIEDDFTPDNICNILRITIEAHYINKRKYKNLSGYTDNRIQETVSLINDKFVIRERLEELISDNIVSWIGDNLETVFFSEDYTGGVSGIRPSRNEIIQYLESAIGYKTQEQLYRILRKNFGENCIISEAGDQFVVSCNVDLKDYFNGNNIDWLMCEVENYCKGYGLPIRKVALDLHANAVSSKAPNPATRLLYKRDFGSIMIDTYEYHKAGAPKHSVMYGHGEFVSAKQKKAETITKTDRVLKSGDIVQHKTLGEAMVIGVTVRKNKDDLVHLMFNDGTEKAFGYKSLLKFLI